MRVLSIERTYPSRPNRLSDSFRFAAVIIYVRYIHIVVIRIAAESLFFSALFAVPLFADVHIVIY